MRLSVREHISDIRGTVGSIFTKFCTQIPCGRGSVLHWRRCDTLCISSFIDDVTFGRIGRDAETWRLHCAATAMSGVAIVGRSVMSMNVCLGISSAEPCFALFCYELLALVSVDF